MDIRRFFGNPNASKSKVEPKVEKKTEKPKKKEKIEKSPSIKSKRKSPQKKRKPNQRNHKDDDSDVEIIERSEDDEFTTLKHKKNSPKVDKNGNNKKSKKTKKMVISSDSEEEIQCSVKRKSSRRGGVILDSDSEPEEPIPEKKKSRKRPKKCLSDSDDDVANHPSAIEEAFKRVTPVVSKAKSALKTKSPSQQKSTTSVMDFFGSSTVKQKEIKKTVIIESTPAKQNDEIHEDEEFEQTLLLLDENYQSPAKKIKLDSSPAKVYSLASKVASKSKHFVEDTPERKPMKLEKLPKKSPQKTPPKKIETPPKKTQPKKESPNNTESPMATDQASSAKKGAYRSYLSREGPRALGSKEIPQGAENCLEGLTFVITGVLESMERSESQSLIERYGGKVTGSLSKRTSYVVVGRDAGESKMAKANQLGTKQLDEDGLLDLIRKLPGKTSKYEIEAAKQSQSKPSTAKFKSSPSLAKISQSKMSPAKPAAKKATDEGSSQSLMWVDKYKPQTLKQIIGQTGDKSNARKLMNWLQNWHRNISSGKKPAFNRFSDDGSGFKAALLSGPPGVGKTTTATLVCKEAGFSFVELNASDTRSKRKLKDEVSESLNNHTLVDFFGGQVTPSEGQRHCLVMDEVDGMAGNEDRGGVAELIQLIKNSKIPVICMCNDRNHQKIRSLANHCFDLRFQRPRVEQIKAAMMSVAFKEGLKISPPALQEVIVAANQDVRQIMHNLSMWTSTDRNLSYDQAKSDANKAKKDAHLGPFDVCRQVFAGGERMSVIDKTDLFFQDYSFGPLFVQENYPSCTPFAARGDMRMQMKLLSQAADSIAQGDLVDRQIRSTQNWGLLPTQAIFSTVLPGEAMKGSIGQMIQFPQWLGKNSTRNKNDRTLQELRTHMGLKNPADKHEINMDYLPLLRKALTQPLATRGAEGIGEIIQVMDEYSLTREDFDSLLEVATWPNSKNCMANVDSKVKAAFTRTYNKSVHLTPYATGSNVAKKKRGAGGGEELEEEEGGEVEEEEEEEEDITKDSMIKLKKKPAAKAVKATGKGKAGKSGSKGKLAKKK